jgi:hypothetical protein
MDITDTDDVLIEQIRSHKNEIIRRLKVLAQRGHAIDITSEGTQISIKIERNIKTSKVI